MNAGQFFDVFTTEDLKVISLFLEKITPQVSKGNYHSGFTKSENIYPIVKKLVISKLDQVFGRKINPHHLVALKEVRPLGIHTDHFKGDTMSDLAIVIPLTSIEELTHTVVFNQSSETVATLAEFIADPTTIKLDNNAKYLYNNLCSHIDPAEALEYLSVKGVYRWIPGSVIYFDRKLFHCSDNFFDNGLEYKRAFVIFSTLDDN